MTIRKRRKVRRFRGTRRHGWGVTKGHKKHGLKGGRGNAGMTSHLWIKVVKAQKSGERLIGKHGFKIPQALKEKNLVLNVSHLDASLDTLVDQGKAKFSRGTYTVDLNEVGYKKLLGQGEISKKVKVTVESASARAIEKVEAAGGKVITAQE